MPPTLKEMDVRNTEYCVNISPSLDCVRRLRECAWVPSECVRPVLNAVPRGLICDLIPPWHQSTLRSCLHSVDVTALYTFS
jgi:hypothetical protein